MSHNIKTLQNLPTGHLKKLHAKYSNKKSKEASQEAKTIKRILNSRMHEHYKQELYNSIDESFADPARNFELKNFYTNTLRENIIKCSDT
jgi:hypothetical protein